MNQSEKNDNNERNEIKNNETKKTNDKKEKPTNSNYLNEVTLECLLNKSRYGSYLGYDSKGKKAKVSSKDIKFYRKRIQQLTKDLLLSSINKIENMETSEQQQTCSQEVIEAFDNYVFLCTRYFKNIDFNDINQETVGLTETESDTVDLNIEDNIYIENKEHDINMKDIDIEKNTIEKINETMVRSIKVKQSTLLDNFVKKTKSKAEPIILPHKKNINLKEPSLKTKGIKKDCLKKNITNNYEGYDKHNEKESDNKKEIDTSEKESEK
jgi:hypothetical protein